MSDPSTIPAAFDQRISFAERLARIEVKLDAALSGLVEHNNRLSVLEQRFTTYDGRIAASEERLSTLDSRIAVGERRYAEVDLSVSQFKEWRARVDKAVATVEHQGIVTRERAAIRKSDLAIIGAVATLGGTVLPILLRFLNV